MREHPRVARFESREGSCGEQAAGWLEPTEAVPARRHGVSKYGSMSVKAPPAPSLLAARGVSIRGAPGGLAKASALSRNTARPA